VALSPGQTLANGQYRILRLLGRGGYGFVYHAQDLLLHEDVALKELIPALVGDEAMLKRFLAEARATIRLTHKRIVRTHNVFNEGGNYYIAMEYMAGGSLEEQLCAGGPPGVEGAVRIAVDVCEGLSAAHDEGVVHCDLKPGNILFAADGSVKVADFGIAHLSGQAFSRTWQTSETFVAGTLPYMSPEQTDGVRDDVRVDLYALGAVLYRLLAGRAYLDFDERSTPHAQADNVYRIHSQAPPPPSQYNRRVPAWLDGVVLKALAKLPEERYGSADELRAALLAREGSSIPIGARTERVAVRPGARVCLAGARRRGWQWAAAGSGALLLLAAALAILLGGKGGRTEGGTATAVDTAGMVSTSAPSTAPAPTAAPTAAPSDKPATSPPPTPSGTPKPSSPPAPTPGSPQADLVMAFNPGPGADTKYGDPRALLGAPDLVENPCCQGMVRLGRGGSVLLAFGDNTIVDGEGADFQVYGESAGDDSLLVEVSADGQTWEAYPKVKESPDPLDLGDVGLGRALFVRLTDLESGTSTGAELDAVIALHSGPGPAALPDLPDAVARKDVTLYEGESSRMKTVGQARAGDALTVLGPGTAAGWAKVRRADGTGGWCTVSDLGLNVTLRDRLQVAGPATPAPPGPQAGDTRLRSKDGMVMVYVPAGEFAMGSPSGQGDDDEHPQHTVTLDAFWIDRTEVTNEQFRAFVNAAGHPAPTTCTWGDPTFDDPAKAKHPVVCVGWDDAVAYCRWVGARLPTEAEWEKAARGTDGRVYPWGDSLDGSKVNFCDRNCQYLHKDADANDGYAQTAPVGSYRDGASPYGVLDMAGSVWEWVGDWYDAGYYARSPARNPQGPTSGSYRVLRGGSWYAIPLYLRSADRPATDSGGRLSRGGFRCNLSSTSSP
jgi:formylglycine-generating enzyme required for sulfatase activity